MIPERDPDQWAVTFVLVAVGFILYQAILISGAVLVWLLDGLRDPMFLRMLGYGLMFVGIVTGFLIVFGAGVYAGAAW